MRDGLSDNLPDDGDRLVHHRLALGVQWAALHHTALYDRPRTNDARGRSAQNTRASHFAYDRLGAA